MRKLVLLFSILCSSVLVGQETSINNLEGTKSNSWIRLQYFNVDMPVDKVSYNLRPEMGFIGAHYQIPVTKNLYTGAGFYTALFGDQSGLFTLGVDLGYQTQLFENIYFDTNIHVGGGGGFRSLVNGGLFLNPNIGFKYKKNGFSIGAHYSSINFANGIIRSDGISFFAEIPSIMRYAPYKERFQEFTVANISNESFWKQPSIKSVQQLRFDYYFPTGNTRNEKHERIDHTLSILGFEYQRYLTEDTFIFAHTDAMYGGLTAGYMQLLFGGGHNIVNTDFLNLFVKAAVGASGGRLAQDGGIVGYPSAGFDLKINKRISLSGHGGYIKGLDGSMEAYTMGFGIKYINYTGGTEEAVDQSTHQTFRTQGIKVSVENQYYWDAPRFGAHTVDLGMLAIKLRYDLNKALYFVGETSFAYEGNSGGYAHGVVGLGYETPRFLKNKFSLFFEAVGGAAGGGRVDSAEGLVIKPIAGINYHTSDSFSIYASGGHLKSIGGTVGISTVNVGITYGLSSLIAKN